VAGDILRHFSLTKLLIAIVIVNTSGPYSWEKGPRDSISIVLAGETYYEKGRRLRWYAVETGRLSTIMADTGGEKAMVRDRVAAFFDFDRTLIEAESGRIGMEWLRRHGMLSARFLLRVIGFSYLYRMRLISNERMVRVMLTFYRGRRLTDFEEGAEVFYRDYLKPHLAPAVVERVNYHRQEGHLLVLISGSIRYMLAPVATDLGFDVLLCTDLEVGADGLLTGRSEGEICVGQTKRRLTLQLAAQKGLDLARSYAYGNDIADVNLLGVVGHPRVVEPDAALRRIARRRAWPILSYR